MGYLRLLLSTSIICGLVLPVIAQGADTLAPRADIGVKAGSRRSTLTTEVWAPLAQKNDRVIYADVRLMGDNDENREGNLGFGYRQIYKPANSVIGVHGWIDRRRTENNSTFHQATIGVEALGNKVDFRANGYVPLNNAHRIYSGNTNPYLAGSGIFYDTQNILTETPQYGVDAEAGYRLPVFEKHIDAIRFFTGGYHFFRNQTENVTGFRIRTEAQINRLMSVGARFQHDDPRGSQGFVEATFRFPFSAKKLYQQDFLRSRLDESPERDIDIVTGSKVTPGQKMLPVYNTVTGQQQRVLYVDNANTQAGDGTKENPFSNLNAAQAALQANDVLYIAHGDGTSRNMDQGIVIDKAGVTLIGSGSDFIFDAGKFSAGNNINYSGTVIKVATVAPVITNTQPFIDDGSGLVTSNTGNGVFIKQDNVTVSGITVTGANASGIYALASQSGVTFNNVTISNVTTSNNNGRGILVAARGTATFDNVMISNSTSNNNLGSNGHGIEVRSQAAGSKINNIMIQNNTTNDNNAIGIYTYAFTSGQIGNAVISHNSAINNTAYGIRVGASGAGIVNSVIIDSNTAIDNNTGGLGIFATGAGSTITNSTISNNAASRNDGYGIYTLAQSNGQLGNNLVNNNIVTGNGDYGLYAQASSSGIVDVTTLRNNTVSGNVNYGLYAFSLTAGKTNTLIVDGNSFTNNTNMGMVIRAENTNSTFGAVTVTNNISTGNTRGLYLWVNSGRINSATIQGNSLNYNNGIGLYLNGANSTAILNNVTVSSNDMIGNTSNGVRIVKAAVGTTLLVDMGGGALGSIGQNRVFGNSDSLYVDRYTLSAGSNWWNNSGAPPSVVTLNNGATVDYTTPLAADPRP